MDETVLEKLIVKSESLKEWASQFINKRSSFEDISKTGIDFFVGISGLRGVGKTVLLLQLAKQMKSSVYFSADSSYLLQYSLYEIYDALRKKGMKTLFIDEIHTRSGWTKDLKTIYDEHEVRIFFSGSSSLKLKESSADLSRRVVMYTIKPVSFREHLNIRKGFDIPVYTFEQIINHGKEISLKHLKAFEYIDEYCKSGGVLYSGEGFEKALENAIQKAITVDLASLRNINIKYEHDVWRLLYHIASSQPFEASFSSISQKLGVSKTFAIRLIDDLVHAGLLEIVFPCKRKGKNMLKEPKIYLPIPIRMFLNSNPEKGSLREEFFVNHVPVSCYLKTERGEKTPDFIVNGKTIEVGGASKSFMQNSDYIAVDSALWEENRIPLFLFGFLY